MIWGCPRNKTHSKNEQRQDLKIKTPSPLTTLDSERDQEFCQVISHKRSPLSPGCEQRTPSVSSVGECCSDAGRRGVASKDSCCRKDSAEALLGICCESFPVPSWMDTVAELSTLGASLAPTFKGRGKQTNGLLHMASPCCLQRWAPRHIRWVFEGPDHRKLPGSLCSRVQNKPEIVSAVPLLEVK